jgi:hypothetical protein
MSDYFNSLDIDFNAVLHYYATVAKVRFATVTEISFPTSVMRPSSSL